MLQAFAGGLFAFHRARSHRPSERNDAELAVVRTPSSSRPSSGRSGHFNLAGVTQHRVQNRVGDVGVPICSCRSRKPAGPRTACEILSEGLALERSTGTKGNMGQLRAIDLFCGAGGSSLGASAAGVRMVAGFDLWQRATDVYRANFPGARTFTSRLEDLDPKALAPELGPVDIILASPECTNHSVAKGAAERCETSRATAFQVVRYARAFLPRWIIVENVTSMRNWSRYEEFLGELEDLGYGVRAQALDASRFGVPQRRRRLFIACERGRKPPEVRPAALTPQTSAAAILCPKGTYRWSPLRTARRARATLERAERAIAVLGEQSRFLIVYYGSDYAGGWQSLDVPLRTITTLDRFALVEPGPQGHQMRMLQVPELKAAMGMPREFRIEVGTRREQIKLVGNAVCPPVVKAIIETMVRQQAVTQPSAPGTAEPLPVTAASAL